MYNKEASDASFRRHVNWGAGLGFSGITLGVIGGLGGHFHFLSSATASILQQVALGLLAVAILILMSYSPVID